MQYMRGNSRDYDEWEALGASGWSYKDVLPYFKKSERFHESGEFDEKYHGTKGEKIEPRNSAHLRNLESVNF